jgi:hypothetical protein
MRTTSDQAFGFEQGEHGGDGRGVGEGALDQFLLGGGAIAGQHGEEDILIGGHSVGGEGMVAGATEMRVGAAELHGDLMPEIIGLPGRYHVYETIAFVARCVKTQHIVLIHSYSFTLRRRIASGSLSRHDNSDCS